jgi:hypothetical protein
LFKFKRPYFFLKKIRSLGETNSSSDSLGIFFVENLTLAFGAIRMKPKLCTSVPMKMDVEVGRRQAKWRRHQLQWQRSTKPDSVLFFLGADLHNFSSIRVGIEHGGQKS